MVGVMRFGIRLVWMVKKVTSDVHG